MGQKKSILTEKFSFQVNKNRIIYNINTGSLVFSSVFLGLLGGVYYIF